MPYCSVIASTLQHLLPAPSLGHLPFGVVEATSLTLGIASWRPDDLLRINSTESMATSSIAARGLGAAEQEATQPSG